MKLKVLRELGAPNVLRKAADILDERGSIMGVTGHKGTGRVDIVGAIGLALGAPESSVWGGIDQLHEGVAKTNYGLFSAILDALEAKVDESLTTWNDAHTHDQATELLRSLANEIEGA
jgi:hypothetical protein